VPRGKAEGQVFRALQGHKTVAGGNAPGMGDARSPTLKGSYSRGSQGGGDVTRIRPVS
jgi:hypothetical protein